MKDEFKIAAIQAGPVFFDWGASTEKSCRLIADAGARGIELAAFGESWIPGYPFQVTMFGHDDAWFETTSDYLDQAVLVPSPITDQLCDTARDWPRQLLQNAIKRSIILP